MREGSVRPLESLKEAVRDPADRARLERVCDPLSQFTSLWMILSEAMLIDKLFERCGLRVKSGLLSVRPTPFPAPCARFE